MDVRIKVVSNTVPEHMERATDAVENFPEYVSDYFIDSLQGNAPRTTGELANSFYPVNVGQGIIEIWSDADHAHWVDKGTGRFGPRRRPLQPVRAKALKFYSKQLRNYVIFKDYRTAKNRASMGGWARARGMDYVPKWPRGMKGQEFVAKAEKETTDELERLLEDALRDERANF